MAAGFKDRNGIEWFPVWHGENLSDWLRFTGISLDQFTDMKIPAFAIVEAMWYTVRGQAEQELGRSIDRRVFLRRFDTGHIVTAIEVLIKAFNESMPTKEDLPPGMAENLDGENPLEKQPEEPSSPSPGTPG